MKENERVDDLGRCGYRIIQDPTRFCFGMDAVLLSDFAYAAPGDTVMDLCTGTGVIPILMKARYPKASYTALELEPDMADMARRSVELNGLGDSIEICTGDVRRVREEYPAGRFRVVTCNPPYIKVGTGVASDTANVSMARHETHCTLRDVCEAAAHLLYSHGRFCLVHRPQRLAEIFEEMTRVGIEPKRLRTVHPYADSEPQQVLVEGVFRGGKELRVLPPLIVYEKPGVYTPEVLKIYGMEETDNG